MKHTEEIIQPAISNNKMESYKKMSVNQCKLLFLIITISRG